MSIRSFHNLPGQGRGKEKGQGKRSGNKPGSGPNGSCICPRCGNKIPHLAGRPCKDINYLNCGTKMVRE
jgi:hypothetical protein